MMDATYRRITWQNVNRDNGNPDQDKYDSGHLVNYPGKSGERLLIEKWEYGQRRNGTQPKYGQHNTAVNGILGSYGP